MMNALFFAFLAAGCAAFGNFFFRKNSDAKSNSPTGYLLLYYLIALIGAVVANNEIFEQKFNFLIALFGASVGALNVVLMFLVSRALKEGSAGFTFAFQNAGAVFPGILLFLFFGSDFGFSYSYLQIIGGLLVLFGLFLGAKKETATQPKSSGKWLKYVLACFLTQIFALTVIQGRCIFFDCANYGGFISNFTISKEADVWFMPSQFATALVLQMFLFLKENRRLEKCEIIFGSLGGIANLASTALLLFATKVAFPFEKAILFPLFAVAVIILCNTWANRLYKEQFNFKANALCASGIFMGMI